MSNLITVEAGNVLDSMASDIAPLLRENGQSFDRLRSVFLIAVLQEPKILECTPDSLRREISKCAADGLVPDSKEAVLLPYWDNKERVMLANYQPMVQGIIKRVKELGGVFSIVCKLVHENDEFVLNEADPDSLVHKSDPFAKPEQRGQVTGGYAVFRDDQKRVMHLETMSLEDMQKVRDASKAPNSPAWNKWTNEMYRKAVLRRGSKYVPINNDKIRALLERQDEMFDFSQPRQTERVNPFTGEVIEHDQTKAVTDQSQTGVKMDAGAAQEREKEPAKQSQPKSEQSAERASQTGQGSKPKQEAKKEEPSGPPSAPDDIMIQREDHDIILEGCEKLLGIALDMGIDARDRRGVLKQAAQHWASATPDYAKPLMKACIDMTDWAIKRDADKLAWSAEHAMFVHKVKSLLGVEKLNVGKYP
ncbi:hypothetical protein F9K91_07980 [Brucella tritici]|jgi:phage RecT family recombinase|uniref:Recombinase RecT n=1 Tax=Brucella tritici TaxID=94626 RepID=A0A833FL70_9HYPH|nr:recombinase RecT [Brucella tritici]KAB2666060.1 hypothetical protein F9K91_07980 [Brucella tritici]